MSDQLAAVSASLDKNEKSRTTSIAYIKKVDHRLERMNDDDTSIYAEAVGRMVAAYDDRKFGFGGGWLCLEWFLDYYVVWTLEHEALGKLSQIRRLLRDGEHTQRNKHEYFNDCEAFYIEHPRLKICVFGKTWNTEFRYLVIERDDKFDTGASSDHRLYVRKIWRRLKKGYTTEHPTVSTYRSMGFEPNFKAGGHPFYGDCRDPGHVLTYTKFMTMHGKCDKVIWDLNAPLWFFFEVNSLWSQLTE